MSRAAMSRPIVRSGERCPSGAQMISASRICYCARSRLVCSDGPREERFHYVSANTDLLGCRPKLWRCDLLVAEADHTVIVVGPLDRGKRGIIKGLAR